MIVGQVSNKLRRAETGFTHWCPGCEEAHLVPDLWKFDGNLEKPTFAPSVKITGVQAKIVDGEWHGEWINGPDGKPLPYCCHYVLTAGVLNYQGDCTHALKGKSIPLPDLPEALRD